MENICNNDYNIYLTIIILAPLCWGIYEIRIFRKRFDEFKKNTDVFLKKFNDITNNKLDKYPFIDDCKRVIDKFNYFFYKKKK